MELRPEEITKIIRSQIKNYEAKLETSETGMVIVVGDGIATVSGLDQCMAGELVEFPNGEYGHALIQAGNSGDTVTYNDDHTGLAGFQLGFVVLDLTTNDFCDFFGS